MNEKEKMLAGGLYDPDQEDLAAMRAQAHDLCREYNGLSETDADKRQAILARLLGGLGEGAYLQGPIQLDYGRFTTIGRNVYINFSFTCLDCAPVSIGDDVFIGPNVSILTPVHPMRHQERNAFVRADGTPGNLEYAKPVAVGDNCWIAGNVTLCAGVSVGAGSVIGAGSVVTRDIPKNTFAGGVPCRPLRAITEADAMAAWDAARGERM